MSEQHFRELIREVIRKELEEMTTTGAVAGFETPRAFAGKSAKNKKRIKDIAERLGWKLTERGKEALNRKVDELVSEGTSKYYKFRNDPVSDSTLLHPLEGYVDEIYLRKNSKKNNLEQRLTGKIEDARGGEANGGARWDPDGPLLERIVGEQGHVEVVGHDSIVVADRRAIPGQEVDVGQQLGWDDIGVQGDAIRFRYTGVRCA